MATVRELLASGISEDVIVARLVAGADMTVSAARFLVAMARDEIDGDIVFIDEDGREQSHDYEVFE